MIIRSKIYCVTVLLPELKFVSSSLPQAKKELPYIFPKTKLIKLNYENTYGGELCQNICLHLSGHQCPCSQQWVKTDL